MDKQECYVCNQLTKSVQLKTIHIASKYSKTPISAFIQRLLDSNKPTRFSANDTICERCLNKFNEYDLACATVKRVESELRQTLTSTEQIYLKEEVVEFLELDDDDVQQTGDVIAKADHERESHELYAKEIDEQEDFKRYQEDYDNAMVVVEGASATVTTVIVERADITESSSANVKEEQIEYFEVVEPVEYEVSSDCSAIVEKYTESDDDETPALSIKKKQYAQHVREEWKHIPVLRPWLETIEGDTVHVRCKLCNIKLTAKKSALLKHSECRTHVDKMAKLFPIAAAAEEKVESRTRLSQRASLTGTDKWEKPTEMRPGSKMYAQRVRKVWQLQPKFENWLEIFDDDDSKVQCKYCHLEMSAKKSVLHKHAMSKKHIENVNADYCRNADEAESNESETDVKDEDLPSADNLHPPLTCPHCRAGFFNANKLKNHIQKMHKIKKCGACNLEFDKVAELKAHQEAEHEIGKYVCHICGKVLKSAIYLSRHITIHETGQTLNVATATTGLLFRCDLCGQVEKSEAELQAHILLHDNKLKCVICGNVVKHKGNLILHMRIHTGERYYQCDKCGKDFIHKSSLRMHLATTHTVERKKQCQQCPLSFKTTSQLNQHMLTHTGEKNHKCPECGKCFAQRYNMMAHYKLHMGISRNSKKNVCPICNVTFDKPSQLEQHCIKTHLRAS